MCKDVFSTRKELYEHIHLDCLANNITADLQDEPFTEKPWIENGEINEPFKKSYDCYRKIILANHLRLEKVDSYFNFPVDHIPTPDILKEQLTSIYEIKQSTFKINMSAGYILKHSESHEYRYFKPAGNNMFFDFPVLVTDYESFQKLLNKTKSIDFINHFQRNRENTKWKLIYLTNVTYTTYALNFVLGKPGFLPQYIKNHRHIKGLDRNPKTLLPYTDNLSIFRCLATHLNV